MAGSLLTSADTRKRTLVVGCEGNFGKELIRMLDGQHVVVGIDYAENPWFIGNDRGGGVGGCDVTAVEDVFRLCEEIPHPIRGLVYLPRVRRRDRLSEVTLESLLDEFSVSVGGLVHFVQALVRTQSSSSNCGLSVVAMSSVLASRVSSFEGLGYHLSKAALEQLVRFLAMELGSRGIRVNAVSPGWMVRTSDDLDNFVEEVRTPLSRVNSGKSPTNFYEVAELISFLLSDASQSLSGQVISVDSGVSNLETSFAAIGLLPDKWRKS